MTPEQCSTDWWQRSDQASREARAEQFARPLTAPETAALARRVSDLLDEYELTTYQQNQVLGRVREFTERGRPKWRDRYLWPVLGTWVLLWLGYAVMGLL